MKCPHCGKTLDLKTNPILLNDYRTSENQLLLYCYKCKIYYVKFSSKTDTIIYYIICGIITIVLSFFVLGELPVIFKLFVLFTLLVLTSSLYIYVKLLFIRGCIVECDNNITPVIKKPQYKIITTQIKNKIPSKLLNGTILVDNVPFPIIITSIDQYNESSMIMFYCLNDTISLTDKEGTIMAGHKKLCSGSIVSENS